MFDDFFENLRYRFRAVAQAVCVAALILLMLSPYAAGSARHGELGMAHSRALQARSFGGIWEATGGKVVAGWTQLSGAQRRLWVARLSAFEFRIEQEARRGSASWSVTILIHDSGNEDDSAPGESWDRCI